MEKVTRLSARTAGRISCHPCPRACQPKQYLGALYAPLEAGIKLSVRAHVLADSDPEPQVRVLASVVRQY